MGSGEAGIDGARRRHRRGNVLDDDLAIAFATERHLARHHLEQDDAQRIDVSSLVDVGPAFALLGRHVVGSAHHRASTRLVRNLVGTQGQLGKPEVEHLHEVACAALVDEKDVLGLEVAVDNAVRM